MDEAERIQRIRLGDERFNAMTDEERVAERDTHEATRFKRPFLVDERGRAACESPYRARTRYYEAPPPRPPGSTLGTSGKNNAVPATLHRVRRNLARVLGNLDGG